VCVCILSACVSVCGVCCLEMSITGKAYGVTGVTAASSGTHTHAGARVQASRPCAHWRARLRSMEATGGGARRYRRGSP